MNTVGKILVVLNLVFALAAGAFMVVDFASRSNERKRAEEWERHAQVSAANADAMRKTAGELAKNNEKLRRDLDQLLLNTQSEKIALEAEIKKLTEARNAEKGQAEKAIAIAQQQLVEAKRLQGEVKLLGGLIETRQQQIVRLEKDIEDYRNKAIQREEESRTARARLDGLLKILQEKERVIAQLQAGPAVAAGSPVGGANFQNPPAGFVKGIIRKIDDKDRALVKISVGSDVGVKEDHTLEIYRLTPRAEYLGRLRVVESFPHEAIGRLVRIGTMPLPALKEGDEVASSIRP
jgi:hypothetical protein